MVRSEMFTGKNKTYGVVYDNNGAIKRSRNFDKDGEVVVDIQYYSTGQVKTRIETVTVQGKKQKVTSHFDENGNKKG